MRRTVTVDDEGFFRFQGATSVFGRAQLPSIPYRNQPSQTSCIGRHLSSAVTRSPRCSARSSYRGPQRQSFGSSAGRASEDQRNIKHMRPHPISHPLHCVTEKTPLWLCDFIVPFPISSFFRCPCLSLRSIGWRLPESCITLRITRVRVQ